MVYKQVCCASAVRLRDTSSQLVGDRTGYCLLQKVVHAPLRKGGVDSSVQCPLPCQESTHWVAIQLAIVAGPDPHNPHVAVGMEALLTRREQALTSVGEPVK